MAKEIERKFLVKEMSSEVKESKQFEIEQFYVSMNPEIRFRKVKSLNSNQVNYYLTTKNEGGQIRDEIEIEVNDTIFQINQTKMVGQMIHKIRTQIPLPNKLTAELDVYQGIDLKVVEVEFKDEKEAHRFVPPDWFGEEVTNDQKYKNKNIALLEEKIEKEKEIWQP